jgi:AcrR family transcriptional regulator
MATRRRRLDPEKRRLEIIAAAERLLVRHGSAVRVEDVVNEARAAKGTFYLYFPTWDDLLDTLRARVFDAFDQQHPLESAGATAERMANLKRVAAGFIDWAVEMEGLHTTLFHSDFAQRRPLPARYDPVIRLAEFIRRGNDDAVFSIPDPRLTARLLFAVVHEAADAVVEGDDRSRTLEVLERLLDRMLRPDSSPDGEGVNDGSG